MSVVGAVVGIITVASKSGWFAKAEWNEELAGTLRDSTATGGLVEELEKETGERYPELRKLRQEVVNNWHHVWKCYLWSRPPALELYQKSVRKLANAIEQEATAYQETLGGLGILTGLTKSPIVMVSAFIALVIVIVFAVIAAKR